MIVAQGRVGIDSCPGAADLADPAETVATLSTGKSALEIIDQSPEMLEMSHGYGFHDQVK